MRRGAVVLREDLDLMELNRGLAMQAMGVAMEAEGRKIVSAVLHKKLGEVGETEWLQWVKDAKGWSRTQAYSHKNPDLLERDRIRHLATRPEPPDIDSQPSREVTEHETENAETGVKPAECGPTECTPIRSIEEETSAIVRLLNWMHAEISDVGVKAFVKEMKKQKHDLKEIDVLIENILLGLSSLQTEIRRIK